MISRAASCFMFPLNHRCEVSAACLKPTTCFCLFVFNHVLCTAAAPQDSEKRSEEGTCFFSQDKEGAWKSSGSSETFDGYFTWGGRGRLILPPGGGRAWSDVCSEDKTSTKTRWPVETHYVTFILQTLFVQSDLQQYKHQRKAGSIKGLDTLDFFCQGIKPPYFCSTGSGVTHSATPAAFHHSVFLSENHVIWLKCFDLLREKITLSKILWQLNGLSNINVKQQWTAWFRNVHINIEMYIFLSEFSSF